MQAREEHELEIKRKDARREHKQRWRTAWSLEVLLCFPVSEVLVQTSNKALVCPFSLPTRQHCLCARHWVGC